MPLKRRGTASLRPIILNLRHLRLSVPGFHIMRNAFNDKPNIEASLDLEQGGSTARFPGLRHDLHVDHVPLGGGIGCELQLLGKVLRLEGSTSADHVM